MITAFNTNIKIGDITSKATVQRMNFPMNSFCKMRDGSYLSAGPSGLYELGGNTNDGSDIDAYFEPKVTNLGILNDKRIRFLIIEFDMNSGGVIEVTITPDEGSSYTKQFHVTDSGLQSVQVAYPRECTGVSFNLHIKNTEGCYFAISTIKAIVTRLSLRRSRIRRTSGLFELSGTGVVFDATGDIT